MITHDGAKTIHQHLPTRQQPPLPQRWWDHMNLSCGQNSGSVVIAILVFLEDLWCEDELLDVGDSGDASVATLY